MLRFLAVVSADCLDYTSGIQLDASTRYDIYVDDGVDGKADKYKADNVTVHPQFNPTTKANNIAVVQFNGGKEPTWYNAIGITRETYWGDMVYARSTITDLKNMTWSKPDYTYNPAAGDATCDTMSVLYNANSYDFTCIANSANPPGDDLTPCDTPYGTAYTYINKTLHLVGFYSYSSVTGSPGDDGLCKVNTARNYYLMLSDWIIYAASQQYNATFYWYPMNVSSLPAYAPNYTLTDPGTKDEKGVKLIGGDFYKHQGMLLSSSTVELESSSGSESSDENGSASESDASSSDSISTANDGSTGRSSSQKKAIIIGVVFAFVGGVLIAVVLFYLFKQWNKRRNMQIEDPVVRANMENMEGPVTHSGINLDRMQNQAALDVLLYTQVEQPPIYDDDIQLRPQTVKGKTVDKN
ncbi:hypothetical protein GGI23_004523 [Coemansia sp. RSA 2559]|nr:hypothetical protein GGI23_004523 [Coemansia sp. RSA 2559]